MSTTEDEFIDDAIRATLPACSGSARDAPMVAAISSTARSISNRCR
jgi:hypothetical protein